MDAAEKKRGLGSKVKHVWNRLFDSPGQSSPPTLRPPSRPDNPTRPFDSPSAAASPVPSVVSTPWASRVNLASIPRAHPSLLETGSEATSSLPAAASASSYRPTPSQPAQAGLAGALRAIQRGTAAFPPLQAVIGELISCVEAVKISSVHRREYEELAASLEAASDSLARHQQESRSVRTSELIERISMLVAEQVAIITKKQGRAKGRYVAEAEQDEADILSAYRRIDGLLRQLSITLLEALSASRLAVYDSRLSEEVGRRACTKQTRVKVLSDLNDWSLNPDAPNICWLNGMAGTGKTTVAYTFAKALKARKVLGASFFCTRTSGECRDVGQIIPTIAYQLADYSPSFRSALVSSLEENRNISSCTASSQCEQLLREPLLAIKSAIPEGVVVVIDALDECTNPKGAGMILDILFQVAADLPLKFFVTSRPEPDIRQRMQHQSDHMRSVCVLHEIEASLVRADIRLYLREELNEGGVSESDLNRLAELSGTLFIYASTAIRYIREAGMMVDQDRLDAILSSSSDSVYQHAEVDSLYTTILEAAVYKPGREPHEQTKMLSILWTAVCTREPVNVDTLAALSGMNASKANILLQPLYSVLHVSEATHTVSTLHASFPDFMFDKTRSARFYCDEAQHSQLLAKQCFDIMEDQLRFNICNLQTSFVLDSEVQDLQSRIDKAISPTLSYVAHHWGDHLMRAPANERWQATLQKFLSKKLLFWAEVLSLKCSLVVGIVMLSGLKLWLTANRLLGSLVKALDDSWVFLSKLAAGAVSQSTAHIYISALPLCHHSSFVYQQYWPCTRQLVSVQGSVVEQSQSPLLATWTMHSVPFALSFYPDGSRFAVGFEDGTIHILDPHSGALVLGPLSGHTDLVRSISFSPDGSMFASGSYDSTIIVWDAYTGARLVGPIKAHDDQTLSVCFSSDGKHILSGSLDRTTRIWDSRTGNLIPNSITRHTHPVLHAAFFPGDRYIACGLGSDECPMVILSTSTGEQVPGWHIQQGSAVRVISFSPDGKHAVIGHSSGDVRVWSVQGGTIIHELAKVHSDWIRSIAFSPSGSKLLTASADGTVYAWDPQSGYGDPWLFGRHQQDARSVVLSPDGTRAISSSEDRTVKLWNALHSTSSASQPWKAPTKIVWSVAVSPDGSRIAAASGDHTIYMFSIHDGTATLEPLVAHTNAIYSVTFSHDGRYIASGGDDHVICLWDGRSGKRLSGPLRVHTSRIWSVSFSPDGRWVVSASDDKTMRMWHVGDDTLIASDLVATHEDTVYSASFSSDGKRVVSGCADRTIRVWDPQTLSLLLGPFGSQTHTDEILSVTFSPNDTLIASGSLDCTICVFDSYTGHLVLGPLKGHTNWVRSVVFSPDGTHIVSGSDDQTVRVWRVKDGAAVCEPMQGHQSPVLSVAYSPDGAYIVSGSADSTIRVWKAPGLGSFDPSRAISSSSSHVEPHSAIAGGLKISDDGWARDDKSQLVFWVPADMVSLFSGFPGALGIGSPGTLRIDYSEHLFIGDEWDRCFVGAE
ncbi:WD40 repeat-like protein, partial [Rhizoctonia solani]